MSTPKKGEPKDPTIKTWTAKKDEDYKPSSSLKINPESKPSIITRSSMQKIKRKQFEANSDLHEKPTSTFHKTPTVKHPVTLFLEQKPTKKA